MGEPHTGRLDPRWHRNENACRLRLARRDDAEPLTRLINGAFAPDRALLDGEQLSAEDVRALLDTGDFIVADEGGAAGIVGCVYLESRPPIGYVAELAVARERREAGIGSSLLAAAEETCRRAGCRSIDIRVLSWHEGLLAYYRRRGYRPMGTDPLPRRADPRRGQYVRMGKTLEPAA